MCIRNTLHVEKHYTTTLFGLPETWCRYTKLATCGDSVSSNEYHYHHYYQKNMNLNLC